MDSVVWAVDPGGYDGLTKTTALAVFEHDSIDTFDITELSTMHAPIFLARLMAVELPLTVVCEGWRSTSFGRGGSTEPTAQTVGAIRWTCDYRGIDLVTQANNIKTAGLAAMGRAGIELRGKNQHQRDAEMHGWNYVLRTLAN